MSEWEQVRGAAVIDLSVVTAPDLPSGWPGHMPFATKVWNWYVPLRERQGSIPSTAPYQTRFWVIDEHTGTHFDAPPHFVPPPGSGLPFAGTGGDETGEKVPLEDLMGPAAVIDVTRLAGRGSPGESPWILPEHVERWEERCGRLGAGDVALLRTGWDRHYVPGPDGDAYARGPLVTRTGPGWPAPRADTVVLLHERGVRCVGIDAPSIGAAHDGAPAHQEGLSRGLRYVELLTGLDRLPPRGAYFIFLPARIGGATGGPGRAIALLAP